jgi:hypothetical protein
MERVLEGPACELVEHQRRHLLSLMYSRRRREQKTPMKDDVRVNIIHTGN